MHGLCFLFLLCLYENVTLYSVEINKLNLMFCPIQRLVKAGHVNGNDMILKYDNNIK